MAHLGVAAKMTSNPGSRLLGVRGLRHAPISANHGMAFRGRTDLSSASFALELFRHEQGHADCPQAASPKPRPTPPLHSTSTSRPSRAPTTTWTRPSIDAVAVGPVYPLPTTERGDNKSADSPTGRRIVRAAPEHVVAPPPSAVAAQTFMNRRKLLPLLDGRASPPPQPQPPQ